MKKIHDLTKAMGYLDGKPLPAYPESVFDPQAIGTKVAASIPDQLLGWKRVTIIEEFPVKVAPSL